MKIDFSKPPRNLDEMTAYHEEAIHQDKEYQINRKHELIRGIKEKLECLDSEYHYLNENLMDELKELVNDLESML